MNKSVYTTLAITEKTLNEAHQQGHAYVHCPCIAGEYFEIVVRDNKATAALTIDPLVYGIPLRPYDGREVFIRRPKGLQALSVEDRSEERRVGKECPV